MTYCPIILRRQLPLEGRLLDSITMRSHERYITDRIMESCSVAFHTKRHKKHSGKLMTACTKLINLDPDLGTDLEDLAIIWPKIISDATTYTRRYPACQIHGDFIHQVPGHLHPTSSSWPFEMGGMDVIGPISPPNSKGH